jgi:hypothetical protein
MRKQLIYSYDARRKYSEVKNRGNPYGWDHLEHSQVIYPGSTQTLENW